MKNKEEKYLEYLKESSNDVIQEAIGVYDNNQITLEDLESLALDNDLMSMYSFVKKHNINNLLG